MHQDKAKTWPGPKPYEESDWRHFFGRATETTELRSAIARQRLTILAGPSGAGKTSLLRAGLIASLRLRRYHPQSREQTQPVLVLRDWSLARRGVSDLAFHDSFKKAVEAIQEWAILSEGSLSNSRPQTDQEDSSKEMAANARREYDVLSQCLAGIPGDADLCTILQRLVEALNGMPKAGAMASATGHEEGGQGVILIMDQLEELMRAGQHLDRKIVQEIKDIIRSEVPVRVLLSLREEHLSGLRSLETVVGGVHDRTYYLEPMKRETVLGAVREASRLYGTAFDDGAMDTLKDWMGPSIESSGELTSPGLLRLQAILHSYSQWHGQQCSGGQVDLQGFACWLLGEPAGEIDPSRIASRALASWIEEALEDAAGKVEVPPDCKIHGKDLSQLVKRIAVRLALHLSSGDFKLSQEESALFQKALGEDILLLLDTRVDKSDQIRIVGRGIDWKRLQAHGEMGGNLETMSWIARAENWSREETGEQLVRCFAITLERLATGNILKRSVAVSADGGIGATSNWQLVHDQMGPALSKWADERRNTFRDHRASLVVSSGITPLMITASCIREQCRRGAHIRDLRWRGCRITPVSMPCDWSLDNILFENCDFSGCIFDTCRFRGGGFRDCRLDGGLFLNCDFTPATTNDEGLFFIERCHAKQLGVLGSTVKGISFRECNLTQLTIANCGVEKVSFERQTHVLQGYFEKLRPLTKTSDDVKCILFRGTRQDGGGCHCTGDYTSWKLVAFDVGSREDSCARAQGDFLFTEEPGGA